MSLARGAASAAVVLLPIPAIALFEPVAQAEDPEPGFHPKRVNIGFIDAIPTGVDARVDQEGGVLLNLVPSLRMIVAETKSGVSQSTFISRMQVYSDVAYVTPDVVGEWALQPNDPRYSYQEAELEYIGMEAAWDDQLGDRSVLVGVVDSGVFCFHPDFKLTLTTSICHTDTWDSLDPYGHGTWVAGVLSAITNNGVGVAGVAKTTLYPLPVGSTVLLSNVVIQLMRAIGLGLDIVSFSGTVFIDCNLNAATQVACTPLKYAVENISAAGILHVASAGNSGCPSFVGFPAAYSEVIAVAGSSGDEWWDGSSCGPEIDVLAPAFGHSTVPAVSVLWSGPCGTTQYCSGEGTSGAAPHVSGVAALIWMECPTLTMAQVRALIEDHADELTDPVTGNPYPVSKQGNGRIDAPASLSAAC